ncbi:BA14K family protein [Jiella avicenniae]|uniref:Lectin-like protein BA14k n=1 Tax=Jiella avicenniae TaxID=2907202 RepID=A0A9X1T726_9HYPH|nr:BA14K family protein [Jiella avicenniae]MCE7029935.1 BA14K family protein [Jiella avicenniae]
MAFAPKHFLSRLSAMVLATAVALTVAPVTLPVGTPMIGATPAEAGHWRHRHHHRGFDAGAAALIGGIIGLGLGLSVAEPPYYDPYYDYGPRPLYRVHPHRVRFAPRPHTRAWYRYCHAKYRSFDARTGTYQPHHGRRRLCR